MSQSQSIPDRTCRASDGRGERLVRLPEVRARTGLKTTTIYRRMNEGTFPRPVPIGGSRVAWLESQVDAWIAARIAEAEAIA
ncbi:AlpA family phage regulatory protein [Paraburkholderia sp. CNPSo 3155]|uniref:helix-turn-helix transcriptional regulator n=1 Tax=Paraburkholderia atlantica TaxID=2654982 RepID=UPI00128D72E2|nr:AlpA family transcriptional regulator [Paraburkholderia atlantica]MPW04854.1 AlpA family phage regulatory protein [Paraburkholderia atlantica]